MLDTGTTIYPCVVILTFLSVLTDGFDVIIKYSPDKLPLKPLPVEVTMTCEFQLLKSAFFTLTWNQGTEVLYTRTNQSGIPGTPFVDRIQEQEFFLSTDSSVYSRHVMKFNVTLCDGKETSYRCKVRQSGDTPSTQLKSMIFNDPEINLVNITAGSSSIGSMMPGVTSDDLGVQYDGFTDKVAYVNITSTCDATLDFTNAQHSLKYNSKTCVNSGTYTAFSVTFNKDGKCPVNVTVTTDSGTSISVIKDIEVNSAETTTVEMSTAQVLTSTVEKTTTTSVTTTSTKLTPSTAVPSTAVPSTAVPSTAAPTTTGSTPPTTPPPPTTLNPLCAAVTCDNDGVVEQTSCACVCVNHFYGSRCEKDGCEAGKCVCECGGTCRPTPYTGTGQKPCECDCPNDISGDTCTLSKQRICVGFVCLNGGTCREVCGRGQCDCQPGLGGANCTHPCDVFTMRDITTTADFELGSTHTLRYGVKTPVSSYRWERQGTPTEVIMRSDHLTFDPVYAANGSTYFTYAYTPACTDFVRTHVRVQWSWNVTGNLYIENSTKMLKVSTGEDIIRNCSASGKPRPFLQWYYVKETPYFVKANPSLNDSATIELFNRTFMPLGNGSELWSVLELTDIDMSHAGMYVCNVSFLDVQEYASMFVLIVKPDGSVMGLSGGEKASIVIVYFILVAILSVCILFLLKDKKEEYSWLQVALVVCIIVTVVGGIVLLIVLLVKQYHKALCKVGPDDSEDVINKENGLGSRPSTAASFKVGVEMSPRVTPENTTLTVSAPPMSPQMFNSPEKSALVSPVITPSENNHVHTANDLSPKKSPKKSPARDHRAPRKLSPILPQGDLHQKSHSAISKDALPDVEIKEVGTPRVLPQMPGNPPISSRLEPLDEIKAKTKKKRKRKKNKHRESQENDGISRDDESNPASNGGFMDDYD